MRRGLGATCGLAFALLVAGAFPAAAAACGLPPAAAAGAGPDPRAGEQWALEQIGVEAAWARGLRGQGVTIAVLDTGVDLTHPDLAASVLPGADLVAQTGCAQDDTGHGTAVAGVAAAAGANGVGGSGVAPEARILPLKVNQPGTLGIDRAAATAALRLAVARGAKVINMSFGGLTGLVDDHSDFVEALEDAARAGVVLVASAGNDSAPLCASPAAKPVVVCVASSDRQGLPANSSNFPIRAGGIAVRAPGGSFVVRSCDEWILAPMDRAHPFGNCVGGDGFGHAIGTSFAAPHVAGLAAVLASAGLTGDQILERLRDRSSNDGVYEPVYGHGLIDAAKATEGLSAAPSAPAPPAPAPQQQAAPEAQREEPPGPVSRRCSRALRQRTRADRRVRASRRAVDRARTAPARQRARRKLRVALRTAARARRTVRRACR